VKAGSKQNSNGIQRVISQKTEFFSENSSKIRVDNQRQKLTNRPEGMTDDTLKTDSTT
jgi:hypothetical protein